MFSKLVTIAAVSVLSARAITISEPTASSVAQCNTFQLNFSGTAPFTVSVWNGCDEDSTATDALADYHTNSTSASWKVNVAQGKSVMFGVTDATGNYAWTDDYTVATSSDASCVGVSPSFDTTNGGSTTSTTAGNPGFSSIPTTQAVPTTSTTALVGNAGGDPEATNSPAPSTTASLGAGGALGGALSNFAPRVELAGLVVLGSSIAAMLF